MPKVNVRTPEGIKADRDRLLKYLAKHPESTGAEVAQGLKADRNLIQRDLSYLVEKGLVSCKSLRYWLKPQQVGCALADILTPEPPSGNFPSRQVHFDNDWKPHPDRSRRIESRGIVSSLNTIKL